MQNKIKFSITRFVRIEIELKWEKKRKVEHCKMQRRVSFFFFRWKYFYHLASKFEIDDVGDKEKCFLNRRVAFLIYTLMIFLID